MTCFSVACLAAVVWCGGVAGAAEEGPELFGCEANPTGDPVGGGEGYRAILDGGDHVAASAEELIGALGKAESGEVIFVPDGVEMDLTGHEGLVLAEGVTLAGTRGGAEGSDGARLFTKKLGTNPLFRTGGPNVRITGLRIQGPYAGTERIPTYALGIQADHYGLEVDNCEIFDWNYVGVGGRRGGAKLYVHHCSIHHCQRSGLGYGISLSECDARVVANVFDYCRHHVAATGSPGCAYEAAYNRVLPNAIGHYFDMHGGRDRGDGTDMAGEWMDIHHNTFESAGQRAVVIRGIPAQWAKVHHNWFAAPADKAVSSAGNTQVFDNVYGPEKAPGKVSQEAPQKAGKE